jgi:hypothetical protein
MRPPRQDMVVSCCKPNPSRLSRTSPSPARCIGQSRAPIEFVISPNTCSTRDARLLTVILGFANGEHHYCGATTTVVPPLLWCHHFCGATTSAPRSTDDFCNPSRIYAILYSVSFSIYLSLSPPRHIPRRPNTRQPRKSGCRFITLVYHVGYFLTVMHRGVSHFMRHYHRASKTKKPIVF